MHPDHPLHTRLSATEAALVAQAARLAHWEARLRSLCDPDDADRRAKQRQHELIELYGGEDAIRNGKGIGGYTPSPVG